MSFFLASIFFLYSSAGMLGPNPPMARVSLFTREDARVLSPTRAGRAATAAEKERADMVRLCGQKWRAVPSLAENASRLVAGREATSIASARKSTSWLEGSRAEVSDVRAGQC